MSEEDPTTESASPGRALAAARAELKLSVADVSQQIKYGVKQIEAIEADDYAKLPGATFVRGMIRSYAKLLHINADPLLADLGRRDIPGPVTVDLRTRGQEPFVEGGGKSNRIYVLLSVAALVAVAVVAYEWWTKPLGTREVVTIMPRTGQGDASPTAPAPATTQDTPTPTDMPPVSAPATAGAPGAVAAPETATAGVPAPAVAADARSPGTPAPVASPVGAAKSVGSGQKRIKLEFDQISWVEIKQENGKVLLSQLNQAGTRQVIDGVPPFEVVIGNAAHVRMKYEDATVDLRPYFKVDVARLTLE
jgi:cytoskeleton protein RodZ